MEVGCVVPAMATGAGEYRVIRGVSVARRADTVGTAMVEGEECVITRGQGCRHPGRRGVACSAGGGPARADMIRICGPREIYLVAGVAIGRRPRKDIVDVA